MDDELHPRDAAQALAEIQRRQQQVIDVATVPSWYLWAVGALMVVLAVGVDNRTTIALGVTIPVFVLGMLLATGAVIRGQLRDARVSSDLLDGRGVLAILGFAALVVGSTLAIAFALRAAGADYPATWACAAGGVGLGLGGAVLMRRLRSIMLANRADSNR